MMRYHGVGPDCLPLANGGKAVLRACEDDDPDIAGRAPSIATLDGKALRAAHEHRLVESAAASPTPGQSGGDVLLQWGHRKRSRGSRAESRAAAAKAGEPSRRPVRSALRRPAAVPPPCTSYSRGVNLRPCTPLRDAETLLARAAQERLGGPSRLDKPSPPPALEKNRRMSTLKESSLPSTRGMDTAMNSDTARRSPSDQETGVRGSGSGTTEKAASLDQMEWPRICISLSRKEKEEDFLAMKGTKLPQRPKKRPKNIEKALQYVFPGMWLSDVTKARYEVREKRCSKKAAAKRRGLKGMEAMDSDSE